MSKVYIDDSRLTAIADAIRSKSGLSNTFTPPEMPEAILKYPIEKNDVTYFDYDGAIVASYSAAEFAELTEHPANPTHAGLVSDGWNWDLAMAQEYVANYGKINIGHQYHTDDDCERIYFKLPYDNYTIHLKTYYNNTPSQYTDKIDWGDGSPLEGYSGADMVHTYAHAGDYKISILNADNRILFKGTTYSYMLNTGVTNNVKGNLPSTWIYKLEFSSKYRSNYNLTASFAHLWNLEAVAIPKTFGVICQYCFQHCHKLKFITFPSSMNEIGANALGDCYDLEHVAIDAYMGYWNASPFSNCYSLHELYLSDHGFFSYDSRYLAQVCSNLEEAIAPMYSTSFGLESTFSGCYNLRNVIGMKSCKKWTSVFYNCWGIEYVKVPADVSQILGNNFTNCYCLRTIDFSDFTVVPSLAGPTQFSTLPAQYKIIVPDALYDTWITTNYWNDSSVVTHIVKASEA